MAFLFFIFTYMDFIFLQLNLRFLINNEQMLYRAYVYVQKH